MGVSQAAPTPAANHSKKDKSEVSAHVLRPFSGGGKNRDLYRINYNCLRVPEFTRFSIFLSLKRL